MVAFFSGTNNSVSIENFFGTVDIDASRSPSSNYSSYECSADEKFLTDVFTVIKENFEGETYIRE